MTASSCIWWSCYATSWRTANGTHLTGCALGGAPSVAMWTWMTSVSPLSPFSKLNTSWNTSKSGSSFSCWSGDRAELSRSSESSSHTFYFLSGLSSLGTEVVRQTRDSSYTGLASGSVRGLLSACIARPTGESPSTLTVMPEKLVRHTLASPCSSGTISASDSWMPLTSVKAGFAPIKTGKEHRTIGESCMLAITLWFGRIRTALTNLTNKASGLLCTTTRSWYLFPTCTLGHWT